MDPQPSQLQSGRSPVDKPTVPAPLPRASSSSSSLAKSNSDASIQSLSSILNNPHGGKSGVYGSDSSWVGWWSSSTAVAPPEFTPLASAKAVSEVTRSDFQNYLAPIAEPYSRFEDVRKHSSKENVDLEIVGGAGEALVACLREVPALYFKEDFELEDGATFRAACPFTNVFENLELQEKLSHYLDVVELHLVKEISLRSNSFFEAQVQLQDLNVKIVEGCSRIRELKETIRLLDTDLVDSAVQIQELNATRSNLKALLQKLRLILYVNQALSTLKLLVASGDCAGALDVTNDLQQLVEGDELTGLHCFRHLREHVAASIESINSILSAEFIRSSIQDAGDTDIVLLSKVKARASLPANGMDDYVKLDEEETSNFRDRLLPTIIGLLRTAKLPSVLRIYRDTLTADMKTAIKTTVAELLPVLAVRHQDHDLSTGDRVLDADGGGASLASKLRNLSSDCFVQLLGAIFMVVQAHLVRAAEVKKVIEWVLSNLEGHYAADSVAAAIAHGAAVADMSQESDLHENSVVPHSSQSFSSKFPSFPARDNDAAVPAKMSRNFRADVLRENTEAVFAACDAAHGRWAKLLGVRALLHPKLRLQEFLSIYNITQEFITATEKIGGRLGYSIRGTLQSQAKAFIDFQHESRMAKIKAVLDQETWVEIDVPDEFQAIVNSLRSEYSTSENADNSNGVPATANNEAVAGNDISVMADGEAPLTHRQIHHNASSETSSGHDVSVRPAQSTDAIKRDRAETTAQGNHSDSRERKKTSSQILFYKGVGYHMVNCGLILLKMLSEYIEMNNFLQALSPEIVHRLVEILKFFNTRTCQLVLGAGAMQVSGLKSITSKHLALASQVINFTLAIIPDTQQILFLKVPESRKSLLLSEIDRVAMDYKVHMDEIHTKLVQIMRERLLVHLRGLPQIVETWNGPEDADPQPSQFARSLIKEVGFLQRVLSRTLNEADVQAIFRQVVIIFHSQISEAFSRLEINTPQARNRLYRDIKHILGCIRTLPSDTSSTSDTPNWGQLDEFLLQRFGTDPVG